MPEYNVVRFHLARALFMDKQNEAALDQFNKLHADNLPEEVRQVVGQYRQALKQRDSWTWQVGMNLAKEDNINQTPKNTTQGQWTFDKPIDAITLSYQLGADKSGLCPKGHMWERTPKSMANIIKITKNTTTIGADWGQIWALLMPKRP